MVSKNSSKKIEKQIRSKISQKEESTYKPEDIYVLEGLEPVRRRPGMYIGSTGPDGLHHLLVEVVCNAIDEAMMNYCNKIKVSFLPQNRVLVEDNGRGIPVGIHPQTKKSALETVMTTLHAGAKFGGKVYASTGGLHGVGVSAVCALSSYMRVEVCREGQRYFQEYSQGKPLTSVKKIGPCSAEERGTTVIFEPDKEIFKEIKFDWKRTIDYLRQQAYLVPRVRILLEDLREEEKKSYQFYFEGGLVSYLKYLNSDEKPIHQNIFHILREQEGILVEAVIQYTEDIETLEESFANNVLTAEGGAHLTGFRAAITRTFNDYARKQEFLKPDEENLEGSDVREGLTGVISVKLKDPQFEGQTKARLGNPEARTAVEVVVSQALAEFLERNPQDAKVIIGKCVLAAKARRAAKAVKESVLRKGILEGFILPGKLADCSSRKPEESELFIVEGDSAGGSCKMARDRTFQAILPLRGKILNVERARLDKILSFQEIKSLIIALGTGISHDFDINKLRYHRIIITVDADSDGNHIRTLLLTLFYRYFKSIIEKGYLYIAQPPLYKIQFGKQIYYAYTESNKAEILDSIKKSSFAKVSDFGLRRTLTDKSEEKARISNLIIQRYKGLGEMNASELWETTMDPKKRILKQVTIEDAREADHIFDILMGEEVAPRKRFIQTYAKKVQNLDI